ncbi:PREDICTED: uncharacterized protein LOC106811643 [Priapulus caudatus]|uniref:Uncharacterized protein LOC106811643 n=1 Tax=Priapulus caudatus TaxID=37621 RepID=A0ABM1EF60_PRICU|nr:PREDICTED: uncharacterized protein LOC106811643 [Priapulus caudatus]
MYTLKVTVLNVDYTKRPSSWKVLKLLDSVGLGNLGKLLVPSNLIEPEFVQFLERKCPALSGRGPLTFKQAKVKGDLLDIDCRKTPMDLKKLLGKSTLYVVPAVMIVMPQQQNQREVSAAEGRVSTFFFTLTGHRTISSYK